MMISTAPTKYDTHKKRKRNETAQDQQPVKRLKREVLFSTFSTWAVTAFTSWWTPSSTVSPPAVPMPQPDDTLDHLHPFIPRRIQVPCEDIAMSLAMKFVNLLNSDPSKNSRRSSTLEVALPAGESSSEDNNTEQVPMSRLPAHLVDIILDMAFSSDPTTHTLKTRSLIDTHHFTRYIQSIWRSRAFEDNESLSHFICLASPITEPALFNIYELRLSSCLRSVGLTEDCSIDLCLELFKICPNIHNIAITPTLLCYLVNKDYGRSESLKLPRRDTWHLTHSSISIMVTGTMTDEHWSAIKVTGSSKDTEFCNLVTNLILICKSQSKPTDIRHAIFPRLSGICPVNAFSKQFINAHSETLTKKLHFAPRCQNFTSMYEKRRSQTRPAPTRRYLGLDMEEYIKTFMFSDRQVMVYAKPPQNAWFDFAEGIFFKEALRQTRDASRVVMEEHNFNYASHLGEYIHLISTSPLADDTTNMYIGETPTSLVRRVFISPHLDNTAVALQVPTMLKEMSLTHLAVSSQCFENLFGRINHQINPRFLSRCEGVSVTVLNPFSSGGKPWGSELSTLLNKITRLYCISRLPRRDVAWESFSSLLEVALTVPNASNRAAVIAYLPRHHPSITSVALPYELQGTLTNEDKQEIQQQCGADVSFNLKIGFGTIHRIGDCTRIWGGDIATNSD